jgi:hypothetical protein
MANAVDVATLARPAGCALRSAPGSRPGGAPPRLRVRFFGRRHRLGGVLVELSTSAGAVRGLTVSLYQRGRLVARTRLARLTMHVHKLILRRSARARFAPGRYELVVAHGLAARVQKRVRIG